MPPDITHSYLNPVRQTSSYSAMNLTKRTIRCSNIAWKRNLVHELLHCKYDWMGNQGGTYEGVYLDATEHQKLEEMAKSLIMAKYGVGYDYFM